MAAGSDIRDILELEGPDEKDDFMTKEALFGDLKKVSEPDIEKYSILFLCCMQVLKSMNEKPNSDKLHV